MFSSPSNVKQLLEEQGYLAGEHLATVVFLAASLEKPLLVEGPAGVGKTQLAVAIAAGLKRKLVRLQCYEGIDASKALYDWNYHRQLLRIQACQGEGWESASTDIFSQEFLLERPLLQAILGDEPVVLLLDELDKSSEEFESFLLEMLAEFQVTIPEIGTLRALQKPVVVLTSNGSRDFGDALRRRCIHLLIDYPNLELEKAIIARHCTSAPNCVQEAGVELVHQLRRLPLRKFPSIAESIDFVNALDKLQQTELTSDNVGLTLGTVLKYPQDIKVATDKLLKQMRTVHNG